MQHGIVSSRQLFEKANLINAAWKAALPGFSDRLLVSCMLMAIWLALGLPVLSEPQSKSSSSLAWPPVLNQAYPDLELTSVSSRKVRLSSLKGKLILLEPIGMSCPACQAFAGGGSSGGLNGVAPQSGLLCADTLLLQKGIAPDDSRLARVQLILYGPNMGVASLPEAQAWAKHFSFGQRPNEFLLIADQRFQNQSSYNMIPGFQLIDKDFVLRCDSTGHNPRNDLYRELLPMLKSMLNK